MFGLVGILNTLIDFGILNVLHFHAGLNLITSNLLSTTVAMVFSFFANRHVVFRGQTGQPVWRQAGLFWIVTASGLYILQSSIIWLCSHPLASATASVAHFLHVIVPLSSTFITVNGIKAIATVTSLAWNYFFYKRVVFAHTSAQEQVSEALS